MRELHPQCQIGNSIEAAGSEEDDSNPVRRALPEWGVRAPVSSDSSRTRTILCLRPFKPAFRESQRRAASPK